MPPKSWPRLKDKASGERARRQIGGQPMQTEPLLIDSKAICSLLGIGQSLFFDLKASGKFPIRPVRLGRAVRYDRKAVEKWVAAGCPANWNGGGR